MKPASGLWWLMLLGVLILSAPLTVPLQACETSSTESSQSARKAKK